MRGSNSSGMFSEGEQKSKLDPQTKITDKLGVVAIIQNKSKESNKNYIVTNIYVEEAKKLTRYNVKFLDHKYSSDAAYGLHKDIFSEVSDATIRDFNKTRQSAINTYLKQASTADIQSFIQNLDKNASSPALQYEIEEEIVGALKNANIDASELTFYQSTKGCTLS